MGKTLRFRQKPRELIKEKNPYMPSEEVMAKFRLPPKLKIQNLAALAEKIDLAELGITVPQCQHPDHFEAGVRYGLAHNYRPDPKTQYRRLFSSGFCLAKMFYRRLAPKHPLAMSGSSQIKIDRHGQISKIKDV
jgi:hypothetical protein